MRYFYDWEFLDDGVTIVPISVGFVTEGREYYAVFEEIEAQPLYDRICKHSWLMENVIPHLPLKVGTNGKPRHRGPKEDGHPYFDLDRDSLLVLPRSVIVKQLKDFLLGGNEFVELWGYYPAYDHVLLTQLWGPMSRLPKGIPERTNDIQQEAGRLGLDGCLPAKAGVPHNALDDARWTRDAWLYLDRQAKLAVQARSE